MTTTKPSVLALGVALAVAVSVTGFSQARDAPAHEDSGDVKSGLLKLEIGKLLSVHARMFDDHAECACGKSQKKIESLATTRERQHARTVKNFFKASGIQIGKDRPGRTQALLGTFSL